MNNESTARPTPSAAEVVKHLLLTPQTCPCDKTSDAQCNVCDGGLAICSRCGKAEAELDAPCVFPPAPEQKPRSNHFSDEALSRGFPDHISSKGDAYYSDGTVIPAPAPVAQKPTCDWFMRPPRAYLNQDQCYECGKSPEEHPESWKRVQELAAASALEPVSSPPELSPCPFEHPVIKGTYLHENGKGIFIGCGDCFAGFGFHSGMDEHLTAEEAIRRWNARVPASRPAEEPVSEPPERIWLLRNDDGSLDDCWQMSTISGSGDIEYVRARIHVQPAADRIRAAAEEIHDEASDQYAMPAGVEINCADEYQDAEFLGPTTPESITSARQKHFDEAIAIAKDVEERYRAKGLDGSIASVGISVGAMKVVQELEAARDSKEKCDATKSP